MEHSVHYYDYDRNDPNRENPFQDLLISDEELETLVTGGDLGWEDINFRHSSESAYYAGDEIKLNIDNNNGRWKYREDEILKEIQDYLGGTYSSHYTSKESKTQTLDLIESIGDAEAFCRSNAIKYLSRFGKKNGKSRLDILKAIHYCILLYSFSGVLDQKGDYETF